MKKILLVFIALSITCSFKLLGQCGKDCLAAMSRLGRSMQGVTEDNACERLIFHFQSGIDSIRNQSMRSKELTPRFYQSRKANAPSSTGTPSQSDATPALYPFALAGGSIGGTGSEGGANALTAISINPAIFFTDMNDATQSAKWGRLMDLSVILPLNDINAENIGNTNDIQYFGVRGRINVTGAENANKLIKKVNDKFNEFIAHVALGQQSLLDLLISSPDCDKCIKALELVAKGTMSISSLEQTCGGTVSLNAGNAAYASFKSELEELVAKADEKYWGLDIRGDFGDPTLGAVDSASGTAIFAGFGFGFSSKRTKDKPRSWSINARAGLRYKDMEMVSANVFDIDGAIGGELSAPFQFQQIKIGIGLDFRKSFEENTGIAPNDILTEMFETDYMFLRLSANVPITPSNSVAIQYGNSLIGDKPTVLSVNFNWNLLLSDEN